DRWRNSMAKLQTPKRLFTRRAVVFGAANVAAMSVLLGRLYYLQFVRAQEYKTLAEGNRVKLSLVAPVRGLILDRRGETLANNQKNFRLFLDPELAGDPEEALKSLAALIPVEDAHIGKVLEDLKETRYPPPALIKEHLTWDEIAKFEFNKLSF